MSKCRTGLSEEPTLSQVLHSAHTDSTKTDISRKQVNCSRRLRGILVKKDFNSRFTHEEEEVCVCVSVGCVTAVVGHLMKR